MNVERFSIPELLFHPSDIGIQEMGVAEAVIHTVSQTPPGCFRTCPRRISNTAKDGNRKEGKRKKVKHSRAGKKGKRKMK